MQPPREFEHIGLRSVETIAVGRSIRELAGCGESMGPGDGGSGWETRPSTCRTASSHNAEIHWYEATGVGRRELKLERLLAARS